jgi:hypothetical protein
MIKECVNSTKIAKIKDSIEVCAEKLVKTQTERLNEIKKHLSECTPPKEKIDLKNLTPKQEKTITQPIDKRSSSERRRSYFN